MSMKDMKNYISDKKQHNVNVKFELGKDGKIHMPLTPMQKALQSEFAMKKEAMFSQDKKTIATKTQNNTFEK